MDNAQQAGRGEGVEWRGHEWSGGDADGSGVEGRGGEGRAGQGRVPDCLGGLSRVGISSRSTRPWNGQPPSIILLRLWLVLIHVELRNCPVPGTTTVGPLPCALL